MLILQLTIFLLSTLAILPPTRFIIAENGMFFVYLRYYDQLCTMEAKMPIMEDQVCDIFDTIIFCCCQSVVKKSKRKSLKCYDNNQDRSTKPMQQART